jgi:hypothetical protein
MDSNIEKEKRYKCKIYWKPRTKRWY